MGWNISSIWQRYCRFCWKFTAKARKIFGQFVRTSWRFRGAVLSIKVVYLMTENSLLNARRKKVFQSVATSDSLYSKLFRMIREAAHELEFCFVSGYSVCAVVCSELGLLFQGLNVKGKKQNWVQFTFTSCCLNWSLSEQFFFLCAQCQLNRCAVQRTFQGRNSLVLGARHDNAHQQQILILKISKVLFPFVSQPTGWVFWFYPLGYVNVLRVSSIYFLLKYSTLCEITVCAWVLSETLIILNKLYKWSASNKNVKFLKIVYWHVFVNGNFCKMLLIKCLLRCSTAVASTFWRLCWLDSPLFCFIDTTQNVLGFEALRTLSNSDRMCTACCWWKTSEHVLWESHSLSLFCLL